MNDMPSINTIIAPSQNKLKYFLFFNEAGNILPFKKNNPASPVAPLLSAFGGHPFSFNDTCPLVPLAASPCLSAIGCASGECRAGLAGGRTCMAGGLAESLRIFTDLAVGETAAILSAAKVECGGGRNATAAKSVKKPVT